MQLFFFLFGFYNSTCFGRSLRPSSGAIHIRQEIDLMHKDSEDIPIRNGGPPRYT